MTKHLTKITDLSKHDILHVIEHNRCNTANSLMFGCDIEEITSDVIDGPASMVFTQSSAKLYIAKALLKFLTQQQ